MGELDARVEEAQTTLSQLEDEQHESEARLGAAQQRLFDVRADVDDLSRKAAESGAAHAGLLERVSALSTEVERLEEGARELEERITSRRAETDQLRARRTGLLDEVAESERLLDEGVRGLDALRERVRLADESAQTIREQVDAQDGHIRQARHGLDEVRQQVAALELSRVTAEADLTHVAQSCFEAVQAGMAEVLAEVAAMEQSGQAEPDAAVINAEEPDPESDEIAVTGDAVEAAPAATQHTSMSAEEAITALKGKIDRLGPVNMMAIEQFDELETRHTFLTTQRQDLNDSIAQTAEAIKRIDETTKVRFREAFTAIQANFQVTFSTLFGGGHAGLSLLDEDDPLESGIDIVASPPGKRLQNVMLLSGGEKALTAIALMFAIFRYKPSPFCLLDEIDAPLDDANIDRYVEAIRAMTDRSQFIIITHSR